MALEVKLDDLQLRAGFCPWDFPGILAVGGFLFIEEVFDPYKAEGVPRMLRLRGVVSNVALAARMFDAGVPAPMPEMCALGKPLPSALARRTAAVARCLAFEYAIDSRLFMWFLSGDGE